MSAQPKPKLYNPRHPERTLFDSQSIAKTLKALSIGVAIQHDSSIGLNACGRRSQNGGDGSQT
jgi:hypothetical protein